MRRCWFATILATFWMLGSSASMAAGSLAYVDYPLLLKEAPQARASVALLKKEFAGQRSKIEKDQSNLKSLRAQFLALGPAANVLKRASVSEQLKKARQTLKADQQGYQTSFSLRRDQLAASLEKLVHKEIRSYAKGHGYSIVLGSQAVFAASTVDITDAILARLKADYKAAQKQDQ